MENLDETVDEKLVFALFNIIEQDNKYLIITSNKQIVDFKFKLDDMFLSNLLLSAKYKRIPKIKVVHAIILMSLKT